MTRPNSAVPADLRRDTMPAVPTDISPDPLDDPSPQRVADAAATENLLRCWVRETGVPRPPTGALLRLELPASATSIEAPVRHWSAAGWHRFGPARIGGVEADAAAVAALLAREGAVQAGQPAHSGADLVARVLDSAHHIAGHVAHRRATPDDPPGTTPFLSAEQALVLGHPLHPTPKSRSGLRESEVAAYSPELRGSFQLHWFAADPAVVAEDSTLDRAASAVVAEWAGDLTVPSGMVAVPAHPWQARDLLDRPAITAMLDSGALRHLGLAGAPWFPTSSLRTVYRPDAPVMLKLSLGLRITNSRRENLRKELRRGVEVDRLLAAGPGAALAVAHPGFDVVRDPGWLAVGVDPATPDTGLDVVLRANSLGTERVGCVAGLVAERPGLGGSRLTDAVSGLAERTGTAPAAVAADWIGRYVDAVVEPVLWLYSTYGVALEAHQQNTLVALDPSGWPVGGRYRDNQGYYFAESRLSDLDRLLPGVGRDSDTVVPDAVADERLGYYLGVNNLLGLVGAFGAQGLAGEVVLLDVVRDRLANLRTRLAPTPGTLSTLLDQPELRCKANLLTRLHEMDELVGPVSTQSVYVTIDNPLWMP